MPGAPVSDLDFVKARYFGGPPGSFFSVARASAALAVNSNGSWIPFAADTPRITDLGIRIEEARTNLFLNSQVPVTQTITVVSGSTYTVSSYGSSTIALSGAGTGTVTQGSPQTFTASTTSLVCTVSGPGGAFQNVNVELGAFATSPIVAGGASAARAVDLGSASVLAFPSISAALRGTTPTYAAVNAEMWQADDGTSSNRILILRGSDDHLAVRRITGGVTTILDLGAIGVSTDFSLALRASATGIAASLNGGALVTDAAGVPPGMVVERFGSNSTGGANWNSLITRRALWGRALSDAELQRASAST